MNVNSRLGIRTTAEDLAGIAWRPPTPFEQTLAVLRKNAPDLNLEPEAVHLAAEIAALAPELDDDRRLALILAILATLAALAEGSTRLPVDGREGRDALREKTGALLGGAEDVAALDRVLDSIEAVLRNPAAAPAIGRGPGDYRPMLHLDGCLYLQRMFAAERRLGEGLAALMRRESAVAGGAALDEALEDVLARPPIVQGRPITLSDEQAGAVRLAARLPLAVITGGPGTGKTSVVLAIVRTLARLGTPPEKIALAAPTGKAAWRMREAIERGLDALEVAAPTDRDLRERLPEPATLHRLLGYQPGADRFLHHRNNPLEASVVIVDESSMVDLALMDRLVGAIRQPGPDAADAPGGRLVLLGDAHQLPSVSAGAVFRDLLPAVWADTAAERGSPLEGVRARLSRSYRMRADDPAGRSILSVAIRINEGNAEVFGESDEGIPLAIRRASAAEVRFDRVEHLEAGGREFGRWIDRWDTDVIGAGGEVAALAGETYEIGSGAFLRQDDRLERIFRRLSEARILCATRVMERGSVRVNGRLHARAAERAGVSPERAPLLPGEPVMVLRNDYERGLSNGDQGVALRVRLAGGGRRTMLVFEREGGYQAFPLDGLRGSIALCYAMTVHKSQGSEFDIVAVVLPERDLPLLTREILYTAVTRSRRSVVIVGAEDLLRVAIARTVRRFSGLAARIDEAPAEGPGGGRPPAR